MSAQIVEVKLLVRPTVGERARCLDVFTEAFKDASPRWDEKPSKNERSTSACCTLDPLHLRHCGTDLSMHQRFHLSKLEAAFIDCQVWVAMVYGEIGCVATVAQPGKKLWDTEEKKVFQQRAFEPLNEEVKSWMNNTFGPLQAKSGTSIPGGAVASYYVQGIATHPSFQRQGLASAILKKLEGLAKEDNTCVALITVSPNAFFWLGEIPSHRFCTIALLNLHWSFNGM
ncbi:hypothetical protein I302_108186 [Kwoniella bestiolae CBS 10118]|uniref:N-acetyltransferase domain-containing protein n=1 Tax=Kwoniella bestiolae CBS 10118 TaxID=1296100 RepID=A0A1B9FWE5_9TREE|nr:hypothetical protein I302_07448 [Kwoniella bestiolae CBS 10118]OCF23097.1 hypothetical protein I302_07448 [Kwoniella bestiolae CBS 10118]